MDNIVNNGYFLGILNFLIVLLQLYIHSEVKRLEQVFNEKLKVFETKIEMLEKKIEKNNVNI